MTFSHVWKVGECLERTFLIQKNVSASWSEKYKHTSTADFERASYN